MALDSFGDVESQEPEQNELAEKVDMDIPTFQEKPDKLDLIAHLRKEHGMNFEKAKQKVMNMEDDIVLIDDEDEEDDEDWEEFYE